MEKILVTGGAGFIGSHFVKQAIINGYDVIVVDSLTYAGDEQRLGNRIPYTFYPVDITNDYAIRGIFEKELPDYVVHFAAESSVDRSINSPITFASTNVLGTTVLLDVCKDFPIKKFINISTDEVYGDLPDSGEFTEASIIKPSSPYAVSKAAADLMGQAYFRTHKVPVITIRPCNNYGDWQHPEKLIPNVIRKAYNGEAVSVYGNGSNIREWINVIDCAGAILLTLEKGVVGEVYNLGSGVELRNMDVINSIFDMMNKQLVIKYVQDRKGHDYRYAMNSNKLMDTLGYKVTTSFPVGLYNTIQFYLEHMKWLNSK